MLLKLEEPNENLNKREKPPDPDKEMAR